MDSATSRVAAELGVDSATVVKAELYKLLLYQEGDHFIPHRDTEKTDGMFATMTILLPSQHMVSNLCITHHKLCIVQLQVPLHCQLCSNTGYVCVCAASLAVYMAALLSHLTLVHAVQGGQLVVHHANESKEFNFGAANGCSVCCAAFYAGWSFAQLASRQCCSEHTMNVHKTLYKTYVQWLKCMLQCLLHTIIRHMDNGMQYQMYDSAGQYWDLTQHMALADCKHELKPVQSGFRLALVYNLIHASDGPTPALQDCSEVMTKITRLIQAWNAESPGQNRAIWMLEHK